MVISRLHLKNFKRFTDLTVEHIPQNAKLVLLIGSNGSGKSTVFDAFRFTEHPEPVEVMNYYYQKDKTFLPSVTITGFDGGQHFYSYSEKGRVSGLKAESFYGRTSFRHVSRLNKVVSDEKDTIEFPGQLNTNEVLSKNALLIDKDDLFEKDIQTISLKILREIFRTNITSYEIQSHYIAPLNDAFERIFGLGNETKLILIDIIPPTDNEVAQINFKKGVSEIHYNLLSAGEKEVINILFNLLVRRDQYKDTVYYLDELDLHLNTKLQYNLIREITENWIPEGCQLWTASHSLGFIDYASDTPNAVILDFDDLDFDKVQVISPSDKKDYEIFELAVGRDFIEKVFQDKKIIFSENQDTALYNDLSLRNTFFFIAKDKLDVFHKSRNLNTFGLIDRDYLTDDEIKSLAKVYPGIKTLPYYSIENLLYHPDNLSEYYASNNAEFDRNKYVTEITAVKDKERDFIAGGISKARDGYPFYKENEQTKKLKEFRENWRAIIEMLRNDDFEIFYKVFPAKDYGARITARQNLHKKELVKTKWFRQQIVNAVNE